MDTIAGWKQFYPNPREFFRSEIFRTGLSVGMVDDGKLLYNRGVSAKNWEGVEQIYLYSGPPKDTTGPDDSDAFIMPMDNWFDAKAMFKTVSNYNTHNSDYYDVSMIRTGDKFVGIVTKAGEVEVTDNRRKSRGFIKYVHTSEHMKIYPNELETITYKDDMYNIIKLTLENEYDSEVKKYRNQRTHLCTDSSDIGSNQRDTGFLNKIINYLK